MTGSLASELRDEIEAILHDLGAPATWTGVTRVSNVNESSVTETTVDHSVNVAPPYPASKSLVSEVTTSIADAETMLSAKAISFIPQIGDRLTIEDDLGTDVVYDCLAVKPLNTGARAGGYIVSLRKVG